MTDIFRQLVTYKNLEDRLVFKIVYDLTVDRDKLVKSLLTEWLTLESAGKIFILLKEYTEDSLD